MILKNKDQIEIKETDLEILDKIPAGNWLLQKTVTGEFYLTKQEDFVLPAKIYGNVDDQVARYLNTFSNRKSNLGILLRGLKGTGKSLTAKSICIQSKLPVILITQNYSGSNFENFMASIKQEVVIFIDEFEKVYKGALKDLGTDNGGQDGLLTLLDGVFESKKLFLLTANTERNISNSIMNRPGRVHYLKDYKGLSRDIIEQVVDDMLKDKKEKDNVLQVLDIVGEINMDSLVALLSEMNMYKETANDAINLLNIRPASVAYKVTWQDTPENRRRRNQWDDGGDDNQGIMLDFSATIHKHPLSMEVIELRDYNNRTGDESTKQIIVSQSKVEKIDDGKYRITTEDDVFTFTKTEPYTFTF